jgi:hypothetical protein
MARAGEGVGLKGWRISESRLKWAFSRASSRVALRLIVTAPLLVEVTPALLSVHLGGNAEFRCEIGSHLQAGPHFVSWYKDGRQLPGTGRQSELLRISSIGREDRGMYQCIVRRSEGDTAQASAELQLGGEYENGRGSIGDGGGGGGGGVVAGPRQSLHILAFRCAAGAPVLLYRADPSAGTRRLPQVLGRGKPHAPGLLGPGWLPPAHRRQV